MTPEELALISKTASDAAQAATEKAISAHTAKVGEDFAGLKTSLEAIGKKMEDSENFVKQIDGKVVKIAKGMKGVSLVDMGAGPDELSLNKAKLYRGMITGIWTDADKEKSIAHQVREKALQTDVGSTGGYPIPTEFVGDLMRYTQEFNPFTSMGLIQLSPTRSRLEIPGIASVGAASMVGEGKEIPETDDTFDMRVMTPHKVARLCYVSQEMIEAADPAVVMLMERHIGEALAAEQARQILYGNKANNSVLGLFNIEGVQNYAPSGDTTGTSPTRAAMTAISSMVDQKYVSNSFAFLGNKKMFSQVAAVIVAAAPDGTATVSNDQLILNALGEKYFSTGHVRANKKLSTGHDLSDLFYGKWDEALLATWWGGFRLDSSNSGGKAWVNNLVGFRAILPWDFTVLRPETFVRAPYMKTTNS